MARQQRNRHFTVIAFHEDQKKQMDEWATEPWTSSDKIAYFVGTKETCPETRRKHWQCYVSFKVAIGFNRLRQELRWPQAQPQIAMGTAEENRKYCTKTGAPNIEVGELPKPGVAANFKEIVHSIADGTNLGELIRGESRLHPDIVRNYRALMWWDGVNYNQGESKEEPPDIYWLEGEAGVGKTAFARDHYLSEYPDWRQVTILSHASNYGQCWFDGYCDQEVVIFDNLGKASPINYETLCGYCDRYNIMLPTRNGAVPSRIQRVYLTSIWGMSEVFGKYEGVGAHREFVPRDMSEMMRRFTGIHKLTKGVNKEYTCIDENVWVRGAGWMEDVLMQ